MKKFFITFSILLTSAFGSANTFVLADSTAANQACSGLTALSSSNSCGSAAASQNKVDQIIKTVTNLITYIVGAVSVLVIIFAGFRFITAGGDQNTVSSARNMLLYAIIGIAVVVMAQVIVHYAINTAIK